MGDDALDWRDTALDFYRLARLVVLAPRSAAATVEEDYYVEELSEALLDLKEATLGDDQERAFRAIDEAFEITGELRRLRQHEG